MKQKEAEILEMEYEKKIQKDSKRIENKK